MSNYFAELNDLEKAQRELIERSGSSQDAQKGAQKSEQKTAQVLTQSSTRSSKSMSKSTSKRLSICIEAEAVEIMAFEHRKLQKTKVNTQIPIDWKRQLDRVASDLGVGKYDLIAYVLGCYLGRIETKK